MIPYSTVKQTVPVTVASKENGLNILLEDTPHHTDVPGKLPALSDISNFCGPVHTVLSTDNTIQKKSRLMIPNHDIW